MYKIVTLTLFSILYLVAIIEYFLLKLKHNTMFVYNVNIPQVIV